MYTLYGDSLSGNCYKVQLLMNHLDVEFQWHHINILGGGTHTDEFLAINPNGKIPVLKLPDGTYLSESNAILNYLAEGSSYLPEDRLLRAQVLQWQFFEQYNLEPPLSTSRFIVKDLGRPKKHEKILQAKKASGYKALQVIETHLENNEWMVGDHITIADISLFGYTHVAHEGGFGLSDFPFTMEWLKRIKSHPKHVKMS